MNLKSPKSLLPRHAIISFFHVFPLFLYVHIFPHFILHRSVFPRLLIPSAPRPHWPPGSSSQPSCSPLPQGLCTCYPFSLGHFLELLQENKGSWPEYSVSTPESFLISSLEVWQHKIVLAQYTKIFIELCICL